MVTEVAFAGEMFTVTVAKSPAAVCEWIDEAERSNADVLISNNLHAGLSLQWRSHSSADLLQICIGKKVLIIQLRYFTTIPFPMYSFLNMKRGVRLYGLGVSLFKEKLSTSHLKTKTAFIHDVRKTFFDGQDPSSFHDAASIFAAAEISDGEAVQCLGYCSCYLRLEPK